MNIPNPTIVEPTSRADWRSVYITIYGSRFDSGLYSPSQGHSGLSRRSTDVPLDRRTYKLILVALVLRLVAAYECCNIHTTVQYVCLTSRMLVISTHTNISLKARDSSPAFR
jgi:hypothetical protein